MRCLITGASGHLGSALCRLLVNRGHAVTALVRPSSDVQHLEPLLGSITLERIDLQNGMQVREVVVNAAPDAIFHLAWTGVTGASRDQVGDMTENIVNGLHVLEAARHSPCRTWIGVGSQAEYGPHSGALNEQVPAEPVTSYGVAKLSLGILSKKMCQLSGIRHAWVRLLATYGPADSDGHLIPSVIRQLLAGQRPALTAGEQQWDYLYVDDAAEALVLVAQTPDAAGTFVLGSGTAIPVRSIVEQLRDYIDPGVPLGFGEVPYRDDQVMHLEADTALLRTTTGWEPKTSLEQGLQQTIEWYRRERPAEPESIPLARR